MTTRPTDTPPVWARLAARLVRRLPAGRYRLMNRLCRGRRDVFLATLPADAGALSFVCDVGDAIAREVFFTGRYEPVETAIFRSALAAGMTVIDVGANWGYFTLLAAHQVGPAGRVIALEPDPRHFARLQENLTANHLPHVTALPFAGGREPGVLRLTGYGSDNNNRGVSRVTSPEADWSGPIFEVNARPVDDLLDEHGVDIVHLIKIDVEGFELDVLEGMARGLRGHRYRAVLIELHPALLAAGGVTMGTVTECLRRADYAGWSIDHGPGALRRSAYAAAIEPGDYLRPADDETDDTWPHMLWLAPGEPSPSAAGARCRP